MFEYIPIGDVVLFPPAGTKNVRRKFVTASAYLSLALLVCLLLSVFSLPHYAAS